MRDMTLLQDLPLKRKFIGLECYPPDFKDEMSMDYYAMVETAVRVERDGFVTKRLPEGSYMQFEISFDHIRKEIQQVYQYLKEHNVRYHPTFDVEEYWDNQDYDSPGAKLYFSFLLFEDEL